MKKKTSEEQLIAYLIGTLPESECKDVEDWYMASDDNQKLLEQLYFTLFVGDRAYTFNQVDTDKSFRELQARIKANWKRHVAGRKYMRYGWRIAVAAAAVFAGLLIFNGVKVMDASSKPFTIVTNISERAQTILPDGSKVWVGACSKVEYYAPLFFTKERKVHLTGEAYFEVEKDDEHPFIVNSDKLQITVVGTKFNIRSNKDDKFITTTLLEGSIRVTSPEWDGKEIIMKPLEQLRFNQENSQRELYTCPTAEEYVGWINGKLHFEQAPLSEIVACLERYYNIDITITGEKLKQEKFTCDFETTENIYQIFSVLKLTNKFSYKVNIRQIEILEIRKK
jgi:ferric-dicitrate binding protein FerR (iron transport regulator)